MFFAQNILLTRFLPKSANVRILCQKIEGKLSQTGMTSPIYGQPTYETHPELLGKDDVTPLITKSEFQSRRERLIGQILEYSRDRHPNIKHHLIVVPSASKLYMSEKIPYFFRQNTDFLYLSGCLEPDSCLVLTVTEESYFSTLFLRRKDAHSELWDGPRTGAENAPHVFGVENSLPIEELEHSLNSFVKSKKGFTLWYDFMNPIHTETHKILYDFLHSLHQKIWESPKIFIQKLRLIKSHSERSLMQKSCDIASAAIKDTIRFAKPGINESQIFAKVDYECRINGAEYLAYPPVVASGNRANIIHYINNNQVVQNGDLVLMDAGCEYHGYASDITRTWPINGQFNPAQKAVYEAVLDVQTHLIQACQTFPTLDQLFDLMCTKLGQNLQELGLIPKDLHKHALSKAAFQLCPHHVSHYLGMDVHDTAMIGRNIPVRPGMVITIEPGVYINLNKTQIPVEFRGIGIRIEDDVLITEEGAVVLSKICPKDVAEIEAVAR